MEKIVNDEHSNYILENPPEGGEYGYSDDDDDDYHRYHDE